VSTWIVGSAADAETFVELLRAERADDLRPSWLEDGKSPPRRRIEMNEESPIPLRQAVLSELAARISATPGDLSSHLSHSFAAEGSSVPLAEVRRVFSWMVERKLCFREEGSADSHQVTKIGRVSAMAGVSPETGALFAGFLRAMLKLGEADPRLDGRRRDYLSALTDIDLLFLICASYELRSHALKLVHRKQLIERRRSLPSVACCGITDAPLLETVLRALARCGVTLKRKRSHAAAERLFALVEERALS
jgi:hypothetical protein